MVIRPERGMTMATILTAAPVLGAKKVQKIPTKGGTVMTNEFFYRSLGLHPLFTQILFSRFVFVFLKFIVMLGVVYFYETLVPCLFVNILFGHYPGLFYKIYIYICPVIIIIFKSLFYFCFIANKMFCMRGNIIF